MKHGKERTRLEDAGDFAEMIYYSFIDAGIIAESAEAKMHTKSKITDMIYSRDNDKRCAWLDLMVSGIRDTIERLDPID